MSGSWEIRGFPCSSGCLLCYCCPVSLAGVSDRQAGRTLEGRSPPGHGIGPSTAVSPSSPGGR